MANVNKVILIGNLTRDVDLRTTAQGKSVAELKVAVNRRVGEREEACYVEVVAWGKLADNCQRYLSKGSCVYVEGYLKQEFWKDRNTGEDRSKLRVVAEAIQFINTGRANGQNRQSGGRYGQEDQPDYQPQGETQPKPKPRFYGDRGQQQPPPQQPPAEPADDDIPF